jgi:hypothetical protein
MTGKFWDDGGVWDVRIAPSNSTMIYMLWWGMMYKSTNKGVTFVNQTNNVAGGTFPIQAEADCNAGGPRAGPGPVMAIDPRNPNICWVGTGAGVYYITTGGTTWNTVSTSVLPRWTGSWTYGFAFDPQSAVVGGATKGLYAFVARVGIYYSSNGGTSFTLLSGGSYSGTMPTAPLHMVVDKFGVLWITNSTGGLRNLWVFTVHAGTNFTANTWTILAASAANGGTISAIAPYPASTSSATQRVIVGDYAGCLCQTTNGGTSWSWATPEQFSEVATDCPWLQTNEAWMTIGDMVFDPSQSNTLYFAEGIGVWYTNPPVIGTAGNWPAWNWYSMTSGIESLETTHIISPPGGYVGVVQWDRDWFQIVNPKVYPTTYGTWPGSRANNNINQTVNFAGACADRAGQDPGFLAINIAGSGTTARQAFGSAFSTNGGVPITGWTFFASQAPQSGPGAGSAACAVSTPSSIMMRCESPSPQGGDHYATTNGSTSWTKVTPTGSTNCGGGYSQGVLQLAADKVTANCYVGFTNKRIWVSSDNGSFVDILQSAFLVRQRQSDTTKSHRQQCRALFHLWHQFVPRDRGHQQSLLPYHRWRRDLDRRVQCQLCGPRGVGVGLRCPAKSPHLCDDLRLWLCQQGARGLAEHRQLHRAADDRRRAVRRHDLRPSQLHGG